MANTHTSNNDEEKIMKENIQKGFKNMFSGKNQPLSNMSIQEVEALKARVTELEALMEQQQAAAQDSSSLTSRVDSLSSTTHLSTTLPQETSAEQRNQALFNSWRNDSSNLVSTPRLKRTFGLRSKLTLAITAISLLAVLALSYFAYFRATQIQTILGGQLQATTTEGVEANLTSTVKSEILEINNVLEKIATGIDLTATYSSHLLQEKTILSSDGYWNAEEKLVTLPAGQQDNPNSDQAAVFVPKGIVLTDSLKTDLDTLMHLDLVGPSTLQANADMVALYYIDPQGVTIYYPNIDLANLVPADFDVTSQLFYQVGTPKNNPDRKNVWTLPYQDPAGTGLIVTNVSPIYDGRGIFRGVLAADVQLAKISEHISNIKIGKTGYAFLIDTEGHILAMPPNGYDDFGITREVVPVNESPKQSLLDLDSEQLQQVLQQMTQGSSGLAQVDLHGAEHYIAYGQLPSTKYSIGLVVPVAEMNDPVILVAARVASESRATLRYGSLLLVIVLLGSALVSTGFSRVITSPLEKLTHAAQKISAGKLDQTVEVTNHDEVGLLGDTFNKMTTQLRELVTSLEQRVEERTHDLELASEVGQTAAEKVNNLSEMLTEAAEMIRARFNLYYTQIYLTDPSGERITLHAGTGDAGRELLQRKHYLMINSGSLNGRAVVEKQAQIVTNTQGNPNFLPNPLLPNTRSEMSVPLLVGGKAVGVLDMQSEQPDAWSESNLPAFEALAGQLAIAIQNAALFAEAQEARSEAESQVHRFTEQGWQDFLDAIHQGQRIGFAFDESKVIRLKSDVLSTTSDEGSLHVPITVTGTKIGAIQLPDGPGSTWTASDLELVQTTGAQLAQHVENLRLLAQAERYRAEAEQAVRRLTHEGWENFLQTSGELESGYIYDLTEVKPLSEKNNDSSDHAIKHPMVVDDQIIGELAVDITDQSDEAAEVLAAVAEQLSGHIENLRLSELNERRAQREQTLRQITSSLRSSNNPTTIMRTAVRELGSLMGRRTIVQLVNPQQANRAESAVNNENESDTPAQQS